MCYALLFSEDTSSGSIVYGNSCSGLCLYSNLFVVSMGVDTTHSKRAAFISCASKKLIVNIVFIVFDIRFIIKQLLQI